jgi:hypothetical protein
MSARSNSSANIGIHVPITQMVQQKPQAPSFDSPKARRTGPLPIKNFREESKEEDPVPYNQIRINPMVQQNSNR